MRCVDRDNKIRIGSYHVYDKIKYKNTKEYKNIYDVARVENPADNPFIRFRIVGGRKDGLNM